MTKILFVNKIIDIITNRAGVAPARRSNKMNNIKNICKESERNVAQILSDFEFIKSDKKALANFQTRLACLCVTISSGRANKNQVKDFYAIFSTGYTLEEICESINIKNDYRKAKKYIFVYKFVPVGWKRSKKRIANVMYKLAYSK